MDIQKINSDAEKQFNTKQLREHRRFLREQQVARQKFLLIFLPVCLLAAVLIFFAVMRSDRSPEELTVNAACESYRPDVKEAAAEYGMSDYVDLILALMMQESSGNGPDVLQSSEGAYKNRYPQVSGGIKDVDYLIECGILELKYFMVKAGVKSP